MERLGEMSERPFLIVGCGSSGSHLLSVLLDTHPDVGCGPELGLFNKPALYGDFRAVRKRFFRWMRHGKTTGGWSNYRAFLQQPDAYYWDRPGIAELLDRSNSLREFVDGFYGRFLERRGASVWGEQTLSNCYCIEAFRKLYPGAAVIHLVRDGRDVMCSMLKRSQRPYRIPARWLYDVATCRSHSDAAFYLEVKYEDLVARPAETLETVCGHIGVPYTDTLLRDYADNQYWNRILTGGKVHGSWTQSPIKGPISARSVGRYRTELSQAHRNLFWSMGLTDAGQRKANARWTTTIELMRSLGYEDVPDERARARLSDVAVGASAWLTRALRELAVEKTFWRPLTRARV